MTGALPSADILAIQQLIALYAHVVDEREWERLGELFTADVVFDATAIGAPMRTSLAQLRADWVRPETPHPWAHHATNVVIEGVSETEARVMSKGIGLRPGGKVGSVVYRDVVRRTEAGWRITHRRVTRRREPGL